MNVKLLGSILIMIACGGTGFLYAANYRKEIKYLKQLIRALEQMEWELQCRMTPLPELCSKAAQVCTNSLGVLFRKFAEELENQISPDAQLCMMSVLEQCADLPEMVKKMLTILGSQLGKYDFDGQINSLRAVRQSCADELSRYEFNKDVRLRGYQTLGLCAGAAVVIMLL